MNAAPTNLSRLNVFQRLVRQWDKVHPYNAAQILHLAADAPGRIEALQQCWYETLAALGIGPVQMRGSRFGFVSVNGDVSRYQVERVPAGTPLQQFVTAEMNRPFREGVDMPLRPFILEEGGGFYAGVIYQHWIADSESIRLLLREWFVRVYDPGRVRGGPVRVPRGGYWRFFGPHRSRWRLGQQMLSTLRSMNEMRKVRKLKTQGSTDFAMRFKLMRLPAGTLATLHAFARRHGLTLNDVFLAVMAEVCDAHLPMRPIPRRQDLALGTIVDLRSRSAEDFSDTFGLFLGFANVICRRKDLKNWPALVDAIARQNRHHKATDAAQASSLWMALALASRWWVAKEKTPHFYRKHMPLAGGISNVNLNHSWAGEYHPLPLREYIRVSPTGPMVPLVFTTTTLGTDFHVGLTYRSAIIPDEAADAIGGMFVRRLGELAERGDELFGASG